jgi:integrase/recombinase XerD
LDKRNDFIKFGDELADRLLENGKVGTYKAYKTVVKKLSNYVENAPLPFQDMDVKFLSDYKAFMRKEDLKISSIHNNFKTIKAIFNQAIKEDLVSPEKYPFKAFKFERPGRTKKERLSVEELKSLESL